MRLVPEPFAEADGLVVGYHSGDGVLSKPSMRIGLHVGTMRQAVSRAGRCITRITMRQTSCCRLVDPSLQQWKRRQIMDARRRGHGAAVYLNRHEGVDADEMDAARRTLRERRIRRTIDEVPDSLFRRLVPSAQDSLIILDPDLVVETMACDRTGSPIL